MVRRKRLIAAAAGVAAFVLATINAHYYLPTSPSLTLLHTHTGARVPPYELSADIINTTTPARAFTARNSGDSAAESFQQREVGGADAVGGGERGLKVSGGERGSGAETERAPRAYSVYDNIIEDERGASVVLDNGTVVLWPFNQETDEKWSKKEDYGPQYTIRLNTFRRNDLLNRSLQHFTMCANVRAIQVVWSDQQREPPSIDDLRLPEHTNVSVRFERHVQDSLNNRFRPLLPIETEAVLSLDDDLIIDCENLDMAYRIWQSTPRSLVGFWARLVERNAATGEYAYTSRQHAVMNHGSYNVVLTKCCFLHRDYLSAYFRILKPKMLAMIDQSRNCEDIAMQFVAAEESGGAQPVWVRTRFRDFGMNKGISSNPEHDDIRRQCTQRLVRDFGGFPLGATTFMTVDLRAYAQASVDMMEWYAELHRIERALEEQQVDVVSDIAALRREMEVALHRSRFAWPQRFTMTDDAGPDEGDGERDARDPSQVPTRSRTFRGQRRKPRRRRRRRERRAAEGASSDLPEQG